MSKKVLLLVWGGVLVVALVLGFLWWRGRRTAPEQILPATPPNTSTNISSTPTSVPTSSPSTGSAEGENSSGGEVIEEEEIVE